ncbi:hypothetical protein Tco_0477432 [Tanacetum coccineum]
MGKVVVVSAEVTGGSGGGVAARWWWYGKGDEVEWLVGMTIGGGEDEGDGCGLEEGSVGVEMVKRRWRSFWLVPGSGGGLEWPTVGLSWLDRRNLTEKRER